MKWKQIVIWLSVLISLVLSFVFGFLYSRQESYNQQIGQIEIVNPNDFEKNSLSQIIISPMYGIIDGTRTKYGELMYKTQQDKTEIRIRLDNVPVNIIRPSTSQIEKLVPQKLNIRLASRTQDGLDFDYLETGVEVNLTAGTEERKMDFSTILDVDIVGMQVERLILDNLEDPNIFQEDNPDLPIQVSQRPAPYFWAEELYEF